MVAKSGWPVTGQREVNSEVEKVISKGRPGLDWGRFPVGQGKGSLVRRLYDREERDGAYLENIKNVGREKDTRCERSGVLSTEVAHEEPEAMN